MPPAQTCPYCREALAAAAVRACPHCGTPHHQDCWEENGGCTVFGCKGAPADDPKISLAQARPQAADPNAAFYIAHAGAHRGPFSAAELQRRVSEGEFRKRDLVWAQGFPTWLPYWESFGLPNPSDSLLPPSERAGFGRSVYAICWLGLVIGYAVAIFRFRTPAGWSFLVFQLLWAAVSYPRIRDLGMSRLAALLIFVPGVNLWLTTRCLFAPAGYGRSLRSDVAMRVWGWSVLIALALFLLVSILFLASIQ